MDARRSMAAQRARPFNSAMPCQCSLACVRSLFLLPQAGAISVAWHKTLRRKAALPLPSSTCCYGLDFAKQAGPLENIRVGSDTAPRGPSSSTEQPRASAIQCQRPQTAIAPRAPTSGGQQTKSDGQKPRPVDACVDQHANGCTSCALYGSGHAEQGRPEDEDDPEAETEMKGAVQEPLNDPRARAEHRLLARLDEATRPALLPDNVEGEEEKP
jgi:hypothetical protein